MSGGVSPASSGGEGLDISGDGTCEADGTCTIAWTATPNIDETFLLGTGEATNPTQDVTFSPTSAQMSWRQAGFGAVTWLVAAEQTDEGPPSAGRTQVRSRRPLGRLR